jgi:hypothetical protein
MAPGMWEYDILAAFFDVDHAFDAIQIYAGEAVALGKHPYGLAYVDTQMEPHFFKL